MLSFPFRISVMNLPAHDARNPALLILFSPFPLLSLHTLSPSALFALSLSPGAQIFVTEVRDCPLEVSVYEVDDHMKVLHQVSQTDTDTAPSPAHPPVLLPTSASRSFVAPVVRGPLETHLATATLHLLAALSPLISPPTDRSQPPLTTFPRPPLMRQYTGAVVFTTAREERVTVAASDPYGMTVDVQVRFPSPSCCPLSEPSCRALLAVPYPWSLRHDTASLRPPPGP